MTCQRLGGSAFNALGTIYERATNAGIFRDFEHRIAEPLQMQDYQRSG